MSGIKVVLTGVLKIKKEFERIDKELRTNLSKAIKESALELEADVKLSMKGTGKPHTPSAPGTPPAVDTGKLRAAITHQFSIKLGLDIKNWFALVGVRGGSLPDTKNYGYYLEKREIKNRPFLRPALLKRKPTFEKRIFRAVQRITQ